MDETITVEMYRDTMERLWKQTYSAALSAITISIQYPTADRQAESALVQEVIDSYKEESCLKD